MKPTTEMVVGFYCSSFRLLIDEVHPRLFVFERLWYN